MAVSFDHERGRYCVELPMTTRQMAEKEAAAKSRRTQGATTQGETKVTTRNIRGFAWYSTIIGNQRWYCIFTAVSDRETFTGYCVLPRFTF